MYLKALSVIALCVLSVLDCFSQACTTLGQTPGTAFPVCGVDTFSQTTVPQCGGTSLPVPCSDAAAYSDIRPFWYKFTCFSSGTLGFLITPVELNDDYDWQLFDITGKNPNDVFTNSSLFVACNWSGNTGLTGASSAGTKLINCAGTSYPTFSSMPTLIIGHQYLLLLSNFSPSEKGYKLSFGGGTANITDPTLPRLNDALAGCGGVKVGIRLSKKMKCSSLATDGSDFTLSPANATIISATGSGCSSSFDMDSVVLTMSGALTPGNYTVTIKNGGDGNTLLDYCDRDITAGSTINFTVFPIQPTPMDSLAKVGCAPDVLQLVFRSPINCNSIAADGSDFTVSGPGVVGVTSASGNCGSGTSSRIIQVRLSGPIQLGGTYQIRLQQGTDGNTLLDECMQQTPAGSVINFVVSDTVSADFNYQVLMGCKTDTISLSHDGRNGVNSWTWYSNNTEVSRQQNHSIFYTLFGQKQIKLSVSNGVCKDSTIVAINLDNELKAAFQFPDVICPQDLATFVDKSIGSIQSWNWSFGNGLTANTQNPVPQKYTAPTSTRQIFYTVRLIVQNNGNCFDTVSQQVKVVNTCMIAVPNAFTPNNDGKNDFLYPLNAYKADNLIFRVYNRFGQVVFETKDWTKKWDGTINGHAQPTGTFVWILQYIDRDTQKLIVKKGTTVIIR
jgi:gliding motility-associated-like protein